MPKPSSGSNRYLKAQLPALTKPVFWASASLFGLSLLTLVILFRQPDTALSNSDRDAVVNLDENDSLTPEERARAAEIDDLSVLLKDLDKRKTIDSVSGRLNETQTINLETPKAIADLDSSQPITNSSTSRGGDFQQLPLLDLSPQSQANSSSNTSSNTGFIGLDPRSSGQVGGNSTASTANSITPLAAALERNGSAANSSSISSGLSESIPPGSTSISSPTPSGGQRTGSLSNGVQPNGSPTYTAPLSTPTLPAPNYSNIQGATPQNSSNNAYSQILNPNVVVPTAPLSPSPISPALPVQPATASPNLGSPQVNRGNGSAIAPSSITQTQTQTPVFGAPSSPTTLPSIQNPVPTSTSNSTPIRGSGNGQIGTFANP